MNENTFISFLILYLWLIKSIKANIEKEVFISNVVKISENLYKEISEWSEQESLMVGLFKRMSFILQKKITSLKSLF